MIIKMSYFVSQCLDLVSFGLEENSIGMSRIATRKKYPNFGYVSAIFLVISPFRAAPPPTVEYTIMSPKSEYQPNVHCPSTNSNLDIDKVAYKLPSVQLLVHLTSQPTITPQ